MLNAYIYDGLRSPFGRHAGELASIRPDDLAATVIQKLLEKTGVPGADIEDVILGDTNQAGEDSRNVARNALLLAGLPVTVPGQTVNRLCASGLGAVIDSARAITCGEGELYIAGGVESMSRAPFVMGKAESAYSRDAKIYDTTIGSRFPNKKIIAQYGGHSMPETGDNVAAEFGISREQADLQPNHKPNIKKPKKKVSLPMKLRQLRFSKAKNCHLSSFQKMNTLAQAQLLKHLQS